MEPTVEQTQPMEPAVEPYVEPVAYTESKADRARANIVGGGIMAGGGIEGYSGILNDRLQVGPSWGVTVLAQPLTWMGAELSYSGAVNEVDDTLTIGGEGAVSGADFARNGGQLAVTFNLPTPYVQPYALGGIGVDRYSFRGTDNVLFRDDTAGRVPVGGGLRTHVGNFIADARFHYDFLLDQDFARADIDDEVGSAYTGMLQIGAKF
jgi:hypothetical protein